MHKKTTKYCLGAETCTIHPNHAKNMYGNKHKNQTQHMETANTHKACPRGVVKNAKQAQH